MLAPTSWLSDFVKINIPVRELAWKLTELGLGVESVNKKGADQILELEITPNRPDLMSIEGIAREIAVIQKQKLKRISVSIPPAGKNLPIEISNNFALFARYSGVVIDNITIRPSPKWLSDRLIAIGLRPINNVVDITNYVMFELGIPLHAFDYNDIRGHKIIVTQALGGESFTTVDNLTYKLPRGAIIIKDSQRIIDLCGIKGGLNSGIKNTTKTVYLQVTVDDPLLIRRASQSLGLRSDASAIFERGVDKGGIIRTLKRAAGLILDLAGGEIASKVIDIPAEKYLPRQLNLNLSRLTKVLGITIPEKEVMSIFSYLNLNPRKAGKIITVSVPTYRQDLKIEEDLIEEVARVYGLNKLPKTLIDGPIPTHRIAYFRNYALEKAVKNMLSGMGFNEIYSYSLISDKQLESLNIPKAKTVKVANPVSGDYEYLRPNLIGNLLEAVNFNQSRFENFRIFELGKVYLGTPPDTLEKLQLSLAISENNFLKLKGVVEVLLERLGINDIKFAPLDSASALILPLPFTLTKTALISSRKNQLGILGEINSKISGEFNLKNPPILCQLDFEVLEKLSAARHFSPIAPTPFLFEDLALIIPARTYLGEIIAEIRKYSELIVDVILFDSYNQTRTLRLTYHHPQKTLSTKEVKVIRQKILKRLKNKFGLELKTVKE